MQKETFSILCLIIPNVHSFFQLHFFPSRFLAPAQPASRSSLERSIIRGSGEMSTTQQYRIMIGRVGKTQSQNMKSVFWEPNKENINYSWQILDRKLIGRIIINFIKRSMKMFKTNSKIFFTCFGRNILKNTGFSGSLGIKGKTSNILRNMERCLHWSWSLPLRTIRPSRKWKSQK